MKFLLVSPDTEAQWDFNLPGKYSSKEPLQNVLTYAQLKQKKGLKRLEKPRESVVWYMGPLTVNAYYSPSDNIIVFPQAILQPPFYDPDEADHINYGAIGAVIGHELGHAIDDVGNKYDADGKLREWMTKRDRKKIFKTDNSSC